MRVLLLGNGAREHALCWKLKQSPLLTKLWCAPGNPGTASLAQTVALRADDVPGVVAFAATNHVDLVVVGPEAPLVAGVADALGKANIACFGPIAASARIEGSKAFAKEVMHAAQVPTAEARVFVEDVAGAKAYVRSRGAVVVKADGLAAGKGVVVASDAPSAEQAIDSLTALGDAGRRLLIEERLEGEEVSILALCDGERFVLLPPAQDHKRVGDGDTGPNTGGMGAYAPAPVLTVQQLDEVGRTIIAPTLRELDARGARFRGVLYAGLMVTPTGPKVIEFNARFGDPEAQVVLMQLEEDLLPLLDACARGTLEPHALRLRSGSTVGVVLAAENYPGTPHQGDAIAGLDAIPSGVQVFHAGTRMYGDSVVTAGGRVLTVCAHAAGFEEARAQVYAAIGALSFRGMHFRKDIGARASRLST